MPARKKAAKKAPAKKRKTPAKRKRQVKGSDVAPGVKAHDKLAIVLSDTPDLTSEAYAQLLEMDPGDVFRLRGFVHEYLKDYNATLACVRMGYSAEDCAGYGREYLKHGFVQLRIHELSKLREIDAIVTGSQIVAKLWEEANAPDSFGANSSSRIKALKELVRIKQLDKPVAQMALPTVAGGVMLMPADIPQDDWEAEARRAQEELKKQAAIDVESVPM